MVGGGCRQDLRPQRGGPGWRPGTSRGDRACLRRILARHPACRIGARYRGPGGGMRKPQRECASVCAVWPVARAGRFAAGGKDRAADDRQMPWQLQRRGPPMCRRLACALGPAAADSVEALRLPLFDQDADLCDLAALALGQIGEAGLPMLLEFAEDRGTMRAAVALAMVAMEKRGREGLSPLLDLAAKDGRFSDEAERTAAAYTWFQYMIAMGPEGVSIVMRVAGDRKQPAALRRAAISALPSAGQSGAGRDDNPFPRRRVPERSRAVGSRDGRLSIVLLLARAGREARHSPARGMKLP